MKKVFLGMLAIGMIATSCQKEVICLTPEQQLKKDAVGNWKICAEKSHLDNKWVYNSSKPSFSITNNIIEEPFDVEYKVINHTTITTPVGLIFFTFADTTIMTFENGDQLKIVK